MSTPESTLELRQCSRCQNFFPNTLEFFYRRNARCKSCQKIVAKEWAQDNPERRKEIANKWDANHREKKKQKSKIWSAKNPERRRKTLQNWRNRNRARFNQTSRERKCRDYAKNPLPYLEESARRRAARISAALHDFTDEQWELVKAHFHYRCAYCGDKPKRLTQDHIIPLSKGGNHTMSNIVPACLSCNSKKRDKAPLVPVQPLLL
jgi:hypothetical protein